MKRRRSPIGIEQKIRELAARRAQELKERIDTRVEEMKEDDKSHYLIYAANVTPRMMRGLTSIEKRALT